jgi:hypothetical protein
VEIFEAPYPSSKFAPMTASQARSVPYDCFYGEPNVRNVTDDLITTPSFAVLPPLLQRAHISLGIKTEETKNSTRGTRFCS